jgi:succinylglutamate desuccinylase
LPGLNIVATSVSTTPNRTRGWTFLPRVLIRKTMTTTIFTLKSETPGPQVAIFCGVHGNERAGIMAVDYLREQLTLTRGTLHLVYANPRAISANVRFTEKNLNRCFQASAFAGTSYEETRAVELMRLLDSCDALLDLHAYNEPNGKAVPFAITELDATPIVDSFDIQYVITNIDAIEKGGSDGYMANNGKIGICLELGAIAKPDQYVELGIQSCYQFLQYFKMVTDTCAPTPSPHTTLRADSMYVRQSEDFSFAKPYKTFDPVAAGQLICTDGSVEVRAEKDAYLLFPGGNNPVGVEAFLLATAV